MLRSLSDLDAELAALEASGDPSTLAAVRDLLARFGLLKPVTVADLAERIGRSAKMVRVLAHQPDSGLEGVHITSDYLFSAASAEALAERYAATPPRVGRRPRS
jgi:antitoxin component HigA of HigAB toxin-antitoxin module